MAVYYPVPIWNPPVLGPPRAVTVGALQEVPPPLAQAIPDTASVTDAITTKVGKALADTPSVTDAITFKVTKTRANAYRETILATSGLISYWRLNEPSGQILDSKGTNPSTTLAGGFTRAVEGLLTGDADTAIHGDGVDGTHIRIPTSASLDTMVAQATVELWVKPTSLPAGDSPNVINRGTDTFWNIRHYNVADGRWEFNFSDLNGIETSITPGSPVAAVGVRQHLVMTYNAAGLMKAYINGVSVSTQDRTPNANLMTGSASIILFDRSLGWGSNFAGVIDDVAIYNTALTPAEVLEHYTLGSTGAFADGIGVTDARTFRITAARTIADTPSVTDAITFKLSKPLADTPSITDARSFIWTARLTVADTPSLTDASVRKVGKVLADTPSLTDARVIKVGKVLADTPSLTDARALKVGTALADTPSVTDARLLKVATTKADTASVTDSCTPVLSVGGIQRADTASVTDSIVLKVKKPLADTPSVTDNRTSVWTARRTISDTPSITDGRALVWTAFQTVPDTPSVTDASVLKPKKVLSEGAGDTFTPDQISGLAIWLDASQIPVADGADVSPWPNPGSGADAPMVGTPAPTLQTNELNGLPVVRFTSSEARVRMASTGIDEDYTFVYVARQRGPTPGRVLGGVYTPANILFGWWTTYQDVHYDNGFGTPDAKVAWTTDWKMYGGDGIAGVRSRLFSDGVWINTVSTPQGFEGTLSISGYDPTGSAETCDCDVAEVVMYDHTLSAVDRQKVEAYLRNKYALPGAAVGGAVSITDSITPVLIPGGVQVDDTASVTDSVSFKLSKPLAETPSITDSRTSVWTARLTVSDTPSITDVSVRKVRQALADTPSITDAQTRAVDKALAETPSVTDAIAKSVDQSALVETPSITDARALKPKLTFVEAPSVTDVLAAKTKKPLADTASVTDARILVVKKALTETPNLTDAITFKLRKTIADTPSVIDSFNRLLVAKLTISDTGTLGDSTSTAFSGAGAKGLTDTAVIADALTRAWTARIQRPDTITVTDAVAFFFDRAALADTPSVTDARLLKPKKVLADTPSLTDAETAKVKKPLADTATVTDATARLLTVGLSRADTASITDARAIKPRKVLAETPSVTDLAAIKPRKVLSDTPSITDSISFKLNSAKADTAGVTDSITLKLAIVHALADTIVATDELATFRTVGLALADTLTIVDGLGSGRGFADTLSITDAIRLGLGGPPGSQSHLVGHDLPTALFLDPLGENDFQVQVSSNGNRLELTGEIEPWRTLVPSEPAGNLLVMAPTDTLTEVLPLTGYLAHEPAERIKLIGDALLIKEE